MIHVVAMLLFSIESAGGIKSSCNGYKILGPAHRIVLFIRFYSLVRFFFLSARAVNNSANQCLVIVDDHDVMVSQFGRGRGKENLNRSPHY